VRTEINYVGCLGSDPIPCASDPIRIFLREHSEFLKSTKPGAHVLAFLSTLFATEVEVLALVQTISRWLLPVLVENSRSTAAVFPDSHPDKQARTLMQVSTQRPVAAYWRNLSRYSCKCDHLLPASGCRDNDSDTTRRLACPTTKAFP
jgi:hypothetical protein